MSYELQVLEGEQQGARSALPEGRAVSVSGLADDSELVLRGAGRFTLAAEGDALQIVVAEGTVDAGGRVLAAGEQARVALDTPLVVGRTRVAVVRQGAAPLPPPAPAAAPAQAAAAPAVAIQANPWPRRLAAGGGALAAISIGMLAFAYSAVPPPPTPAQQAQRAEAVLRGAGLQRLSVQPQATGGVRVDGYLETAKQRAQAEQLLAGERIPVTWQVWVNEQVAAAVQDVFRTNGVAAQVEAVGPGAVRVSTHVADPLVLDGLRSTARRDVPGLAEIELRNDPTPPPAPMAAIDDPGKRVASIVPGDPPYVVTADGTRYFEGALLPTGHRIAGIEERQVVLERNGVKTPLVF